MTSPFPGESRMTSPFPGPSQGERAIAGMVALSPYFS